MLAEHTKTRSIFQLERCSGISCLLLPTVLEDSIKAGAARNAAPVVAFFIKSLLELFIKEGFKT